MYLQAFHILSIIYGNVCAPLRDGVDLEYDLDFRARNRVGIKLESSLWLSLISSRPRVDRDLISGRDRHHTHSHFSPYEFDIHIAVELGLNF